MREKLREKRREKIIMDFDQAVKVVMKIEGGYVNDPQDPGGETKWGISKKSFPNESIPSLTRKRARELYHEHYWVPGKCALLPERLRLVYFDMCVLHGKYAAVKTLQEALNGAGYEVDIDGVIGDQTLQYSTYLEPDRLRSYRVLRIARIVMKRPTMEKYWFGWYKRAIRV